MDAINDKKLLYILLKIHTTRMPFFNDSQRGPLPQKITLNPLRQLSQYKWLILLCDSGFVTPIFIKTREEAWRTQEKLKHESFLTYHVAHAHNVTFHDGYSNCISQLIYDMDQFFKRVGTHLNIERTVEPSSSDSTALGVTDTILNAIITVASIIAIL